MTDAVADDVQPKGALWLAFRVFDEPTQVFRQLSASPRALVPIIALVLVSAFSALALPARFLEEQTRPQLQQLQERGQLTEDQVQERLANAGSATSRLVIFGVGTVFGIAALAVTALVLMLIFGAMGAEPVRFKSEFAIVSHAYMVSLAGSVLVIALMAFAGFEEVRLSLGFLFDEESSPFLYRFSNGINLFGAWNVYLVALGNQVKIQAKGIGGALTIVGALWIVLKLVGAVLGGVFAGFGG